MKSFDSLRVPKYVRLMIELKEQIEKGVLKAGDPLPTREKLMREYDLSLSTVTRAISELERQGWLVSRQGSGTFVARSGQADLSASSAEPAVVGFLAPNNCRLTQDFTTELVHEAAQHNIQIASVYCAGDQEDELNLGKMLLERGVQALIWSPIPPKKHISVASLFGKNRIPVIFAEKVTDTIPEPWYCVRGDHYAGTYEAVSHLISLGHRRIAFFGPRNNESDFGGALQRWNAYRDAMREHDLWDPDSLAFHTSVLREWTHHSRRVEAIFRAPDAPTAIVGFDDLIALEALIELKTLNVQGVHELAAIGHGDMSAGLYSKPRLSTVSPSLSEYVDSIIRILRHELFGHGERPEREIVVPQRLILRESTTVKASYEAGEALS